MIEPKTALLTCTLFAAIAIIMPGFTAGQMRSAETGSQIVRAVFFASPTCPHCALVKEEVLPPLVACYRSRLRVATVSIAIPSGYELFLNACMTHGNMRLPVPMLILGNVAMAGAHEIPQKITDLIEKYHAAGGMDWPGIADLSAMLSAFFSRCA